MIEIAPSLPFGDTAFDVVTCFQVLEHFPYRDFTKALEELHRIKEIARIEDGPQTKAVL